MNGEVFYLFGNDHYWLKHAEDFFISQVEQGLRDVNVKIYAEIDSLAEIIFTLSSFGFNEEKQIIIVKDPAYKASSEELKLLKQLIEGGISPYVLVFENVAFLTSNEKKLMTQIDCNKLNRAQLAPIIKERFAYGIDMEAINLIIDYTDCDMAKIHLECQKLNDYAQGQKITADMAEMLVSEESEIQVYNFVNSVVEGNKDRAVRFLQKLLKKGESKSFMLQMLINQYRRILHSALSPKSDGEIAAIFNVKEYAIKKARQINHMSKMSLKKTLDMLVGYEYKFKSGIMNEAMAFDAAVSALLGVN